MMILAWSLIICGSIIAVCSLVYLLLFAAFNRQTPQQRVKRDYLLARERVDAVLMSAKHRMEVVAGMRHPGEQRMSDTFGSWKDIL